MNINPITSFFYYMWNLWSKEECDIVFGYQCGLSDHIWDKYVRYWEEYGHRSAVDLLYGALSKNNRDRLTERALLKYDEGKPKDYKYVCPKCGGTRLKMLAYIDPNTNLFVADTCNCEVYCEDCKEDVGGVERIQL